MKGAPSAPWLDLRLGDALTVLGTLPEQSVSCCVTSPPYWGLRDYGVAGQLGLEATPEQYVANLVDVFREVRRVLRPDGTLWLNLGDSYGRGQEGNVPQTKNPKAPLPFSAMTGSSDQVVGRADRPGTRSGGIKPKDLAGIPWQVAFALRTDGWYLRSEIIWSKPNPMPESVTDRPTKAHETVFLLSKASSYYYDAEAIQERSEYGTDLGLLRGRSFSDGEHVAAHAPSIQKRQAEGVDSRLAGSGFRNKRSVWKSAHMVETPRRDGDRWRTEDGGVAARGSRNKRSVWEIATQPYPEAHFATFPPDLAKPCVLAGCPEGGIVLDPFLGSGTTAMVANLLARRALGIELNPLFLELARKRCNQVTLWEAAPEA